MKYKIRKLINKEFLDSQIKSNKDSYGGASVQIAINVMEYLDDFEDEFNIGYSPDMTTPHGIICHCDDQGGITGFMAGAADTIVTHCHELGWKFNLANRISPYDINDETLIETTIKKLVKFGLVGDSKEAQDYVHELVSRFKNRRNQD